MSDEPFISRARMRLDEARAIAETSARPQREMLEALIAVVERTITAVSMDGAVPGFLCTTVTKFARPRESK